MVMRRLELAALSAAAIFSVACSSAGRKNSLAGLPAGEEGVAILCGKVLTVDDHDEIFSPGMILVRGGKIAYVGERRPVPAGYRELDLGDAWATSGLV